MLFEANSRSGWRRLRRGGEGLPALVRWLDARDEQDSRRRERRQAWCVRFAVGQRCAEDESIG